ncbi:MAG: DUF1642 domain-containing protein, partial [Leuconostoc mesenteroides]
IKPELKEITEFYTSKVTDYQYRLKKLNEYADALENEISVLKEKPKVEVLLDNMAKQLAVVPQFVADWFDINQDDIDGNIKALIININRNPKSGWSEMDEWFMYFPNKPIETLISIKLYGYTVEKEQLYVIKYPMTISPYVLCTNENEDNEIIISGYTTIKKYAKKFTESEIKAIDERYWQFAVEVNQ